jgi:D-3-phosphoglycerate dehydrogenase / 2-oxoglutarate reductase
MIRVLATAAIPRIGHEAFAGIGPIEQLEEDRAALAHADVLLVRGERLGAGDIAGARRLRVIARTGSGVDNIDVEAATRARVPVIYAPGSGARPVAEGTMALILAAAKRLGEQAAVLREGMWSERYQVVGRDLEGAVLGVVGLGQIGREVARFASAFGMRVIASDPARRTGGGEEAGMRLVSLHELAAGSDIVTIHCPLTDATRGLVGRDFVKRMKDGAILVNVARGEIVASEEVLIEALDRGKLAAVALDVYENEPPSPMSPLLGDPRVVCTPHTVGLTQSWNERVFADLAADTARLLAGERPLHVVNPQVVSAGRG